MGCTVFLSSLSHLRSSETGSRCVQLTRAIESAVGWLERSIHNAASLTKPASLWTVARAKADQQPFARFSPIALPTIGVQVSKIGFSADAKMPIIDTDQSRDRNAIWAMVLRRFPYWAYAKSLHFQVGEAIDVRCRLKSVI